MKQLVEFCGHIINVKEIRHVEMLDRCIRISWCGTDKDAIIISAKGHHASDKDADIEQKWRLLKQLINLCGE